MNKSVFAFIFLSWISIDLKGMNRKLRAKYPQQEKMTSSPKDKEFNDYMAREEMIFNMSACMCQYRGRKMLACTTCPEVNKKKATEYVVIYYA